MYHKRNNEFKLLALYAGDYKKELYLREISSKAGIPLKTTQTVLAKLEKSNVVRSQTKGKNRYFRLNLDNVQTKLLLLQAEIEKTILFLQKYPLLKTFLKAVQDDTIILVFGSFARLTAESSSDLDILIISNKEPRLPFHLMPYQVHQIILSVNSFRKAQDSQEILLKEIEGNHVILNNHSYYVNALWSYYGK